MGAEGVCSCSGRGIVGRRVTGKTAAWGGEVGGERRGASSAGLANMSRQTLALGLFCHFAISAAGGDALNPVRS